MNILARKRGDMEATVIVASAILFVIIIVFFVLFKLAVRPDKEVINSVKTSDSNIVLLNILRTSVDGKKDMADLIVESYTKNDDDTFNLLREKMTSAIDKAYTGKLSYGLVIVKSMPDNRIIFSSDSLIFKPISEGERIPSSVAKLPANNARYLEVIFYEL